MPIYEYRCAQCGHELERLQRMADAPLTDCPACHKATLKRLISAAGFRLKGSGWYETDFKKDGKRNLADSGNSAPAGAGDSSGDGKSKSETATPATQSSDKGKADTSKTGTA